MIAGNQANPMREEAHRILQRHSPSFNGKKEDHNHVTRGSLGWHAPMLARASAKLGKQTWRVWSSECRSTAKVASRTTCCWYLAAPKEYLRSLLVSNFYLYWTTGIRAVNSVHHIFPVGPVDLVASYMVFLKHRSLESPAPAELFTE